MTIATWRAAGCRASVWRSPSMFLLNGYVVGNWAPKIPEFKARLGIDKGHPRAS